ncbi:hypothetical protein JCM18916_354 [Cutibacterium acnes JCM 18916]|nr:hypothetical protein JCM18916_354 [Cutibacterium acnes JCM 18916]GAE74566.1 hypothetical protein JCM18918_194 [Cutibacterium acnes JCM 18918]
MGIVGPTRNNEGVLMIRIQLPDTPVPWARWLPLWALPMLTSLLSRSLKKRPRLRHR